MKTGEEYNCQLHFLEWALIWNSYFILLSFDFVGLFFLFMGWSTKQ